MAPKKASSKPVQHTIQRAVLSKMVVVRATSATNSDKLGEIPSGMTIYILETPRETVPGTLRAPVAPVDASLGLPKGWITLSKEGGDKFAEVTAKEVVYEMAAPPSDEPDGKAETKVAGKAEAKAEGKEAKAEGKEAKAEGKSAGKAAGKGTVAGGKPTLPARSTSAGVSKGSKASGTSKAPATPTGEKMPCICPMRMRMRIHHARAHARAHAHDSDRQKEATQVSWCKGGESGQRRRRRRCCRRRREWARS